MATYQQDALVEPLRETLPAAGEVGPALIRSAIALLAMAALAGCDSSGSKAGGGRTGRATVLKMEVAFDNADQVSAWTDAVARLSGGSLRIMVSARAHAGDPEAEQRIIGDVRAGTFPLGSVGARAFDKAGVSSFQPLLAPMLVDSYEMQRRVLRSPLAPRMLTGTDRLGLRGLAIVPGPIRRLLGVARPFLAPDDFRGAVVGIQPGEIAESTFRALGARPRAVALHTTLDGLDAYEQQLGAIASNEYYSRARYVTTNIALWPRPLVVVMNSAHYRRLTPRERGALTKAGAAALGRESAVAAADDGAETLRALCSPAAARTFKLVRASPAQLESIRAAVEPVYARIASRAVLREIEKARPAGTTESPTCGAPAVAPKSRPRTPFDGVYRMTTTAADLRRAGAEPGEISPENQGGFVFVFDRGRFAEAQEHQPACTWGYGTFSVAGHVTKWVLTDGGGISPTRSYFKPGETFDFRWSLYRDRLTLGRVKGAVSPAPYVAQPMHRVSAVPSARYFAKRCPPPAGWNTR